MSGLKIVIPAIGDAQGLQPYDYGHARNEYTPTLSRLLFCTRHFVIRQVFEGGLVQNEIRCGGSGGSAWGNLCVTRSIRCPGDSRAPPMGKRCTHFVHGRSRMTIDPARLPWRVVQFSSLACVVIIPCTKQKARFLWGNSCRPTDQVYAKYRVHYKRFGGFLGDERTNKKIQHGK